MKPIQLVFPAMVLSLTFICSLDAIAQQVGSFEQLQLLVKPGDKITVTKTDGIVTTGKITSLSPTLLRVVTNGVESALSQSEVREIQQRRGDPLGNGAKWGALTAAGAFSVLALFVCSSGCDSSDVPKILGVGLAYTGFGAAVGSGIDALIVRNQTIFSPQSRTASRRGFAISFSF